MAGAREYVPLTKRGWRIFTTSVYRRAFLHVIFTTAVGSSSAMDIVAIAIGIAMFALLLGLIAAIDRI